MRHDERLVFLEREIAQFLHKTVETGWRSGLREGGGGGGGGGENWL